MFMGIGDDGSRPSDYTAGAAVPEGPIAGLRFSNISFKIEERSAATGEIDMSGV